MKTIQRTYIPGSEWIYFKLYTGSKTADELLFRMIAPFVSNLHKKQLIKKWFFIRYNDTDFHLRIRFLVNNTNNIGDIINLFTKQLNYWIKNDLIWKVQIDTYNRELERYGNVLIEDAESLFWIDSEIALLIIKKIAVYGNETYRWMASLKMIDSLLSDFSLNVIEKQQLMETLSRSFKMEFGFNEHNSKQFNTKYRANKSIIESVLNNTIDNKDAKSVYSPVIYRSGRLAPVVESIKRKLKKENVTITLNELLASYIHMMINRLFRSKNRFHELIIYDFMRRYYTSEIAKLKYN